MDTTQKDEHTGKIKRAFGSVLLFTLLLILVVSTGEMIHGKMLRVGESLFGVPEKSVQYFLLRGEMDKPTCNPNPNISEQVAREMAEAKNKPANDIDAMFGESAGPDEATLRESLTASANICKEKHNIYTLAQEYRTPTVKTYAAIETGFYSFFKYGSENKRFILLFLLAICAIYASIRHEHISLRPPTSKLDFRVNGVMQSIAHAILLFSFCVNLNNQYKSGIAIQTSDLIIYYTWIIFMAIMLGISLWQLIKTPKHATHEHNWVKAFLSVPLYVYMTIITAYHFMFQIHHYAGHAIYMGSILENASIFLSLALFIWSGMLLKQTVLVDKFLDILRPWRFTPETLMVILLLLCALPTAFTGASGVFILAAGSIVYYELVQSGARRQLAMAATAMSGSLGVVLAPCLLIVAITLLNREVTTDDLYGWGKWVFVLTSSLVILFAYLTRKEKIHRPAEANALQKMFMAFGPVIPYLLIALVIWAFYKYVLDTQMNELNASTILPVMLFTMVVAEKKFMWKETKAKIETIAMPATTDLRSALRNSTTESANHIGALIMLMGLSFVAGGNVESSGFAEAIGGEGRSIWLTMTILIGLLVFVGMTMDPFGAIILLTATVAPIAYKHGIHPIHFWMLALVAFELGYLSPPVALNQLLTRHVVGEHEMAKVEAEAALEKSFYRRYERWIFPCIVMGSALLVTGYGPLVDQQFLGGKIGSLLQEISKVLKAIF